MSTYRHTASLADLTVYVTETATGETFDLNADGDPCTSVADLRSFVREMRAAGYFGAAVEASLLAACGGAA